ncbi:hypothetical protein T11_3094 [Trichinella zimbabwensis]|uniref:Uncharacterized protein n=1 Tax=Trichinella zimbabwensis TaxID=268475 RepID=A0A0V1GU13_9BILA|nr:hypothetical protein T11_3094 [Trichinella zimbabwensis]
MSSSNIFLIRTYLSSTSDYFRPNGAKRSNVHLATISTAMRTLSQIIINQNTLPRFSAEFVACSNLSSRFDVNFRNPQHLVKIVIQELQLQRSDNPIGKMEDKKFYSKLETFSEKSQAEIREIFRCYNAAIITVSFD